MSSASSICIVGIGNTLRGDDGIGAYVCDALMRLGLPDVEVRTVHQLQAEWIYAFRDFEQVVLVDAALRGEPVSLYPLDACDPAGASISHQVDASLIAALMSLLPDAHVRFLVCAVAGHDFSFGEGLSERGRAHADKAVVLLQEWIEGYRMSDSTRPV